MIDDNQDKVSCNVHLVPSMDTDYQSSSFYNRKCENSDWAMSWGYHPENDSAVMIMSEYVSSRYMIPRRILNLLDDSSTLRHQVWFRWIDVNSDIKLTPSESDIKTMLCGI